MKFLSYYLPYAPWVMTYMLQQVEYSSGAFIKWIAGLPSLHRVIKRQKLVLTSRTTILLFVGYTVWLGCIALVILALAYAYYTLIPLILLMPALLVITLAVSNAVFGLLIVKPIESRQISRASRALQKHQAKRIAVLGSYGKTTMKELLAAVLGEALVVAATPGNKNVKISHARWILNSLTGNEDVLIFEYGEYRPGDIQKLADLSQPQWAIITGLAPAHLQNYGSMDAIGDDFRSIFNSCDTLNVLINHDSPELVSRISDGESYDYSGVLGWKILGVQNSLKGLEFTMRKNKRTLSIKSGLIGEHMVGPLAACLALGAEFGLTDKELLAGAARTKPFEHRLQPYQLGPAVIIDDTYNGNLEGMKAGLRLLASTSGKRKIYVTPGLVEQGELTEKVHKSLGSSIAEANPDKVILMKNSVTDYIVAGLHQGGYKNELVIEEQPLEFYTNLEHFVAAGDVVLLQNDWPDAYQ